MDFKDVLSIHDAFSFCNSLQFNFFRRTHQSGHHEVLGGAPVVADTLVLMHGSQHCNLLKSFPHQLWPRTYMKMTSKVTNVITQLKEC